MVAINQNSRCNVPIQASDSVDCEKIHATGANPINKVVINIKSPESKPTTSTKRARDPLKPAAVRGVGVATDRERFAW